MRHNIQTAAQGSFPYQRIGQLVSITLLVGLFALSSIIVASSPAPQASITGEWTAQLSKNRSDKINLNMQRGADKVNRHTVGSDISIAELQGLTSDQMFQEKADVRFRLVREAGAFEFEGTFRQGKGAGVWTLAPNQTFISEMRARGYDLNEEQQMISAMLDVRTKAIDDLKAVGFAHLSIDDVFKATIFKITPEFIGELKSAGFDTLDLDELVKARIFKIDAQFVKEVEAMGFGRRSMESLVKMRIFKVTPEFLSEMRSAGLENLSIEDLVKLKIFKIDADFIQRAKANGHTNPDVEELVRMRIFERAK